MKKWLVVVLIVLFLRSAAAEAQTAAPKKSRVPKNPPQTKVVAVPEDPDLPSWWRPAAERSWRGRTLI